MEMGHRMQQKPKKKEEKRYDIRTIPDHLQIQKTFSKNVFT